MSVLRVLQVLPELKVGGVERATLDMVTALHSAFSKTYVASQGGILLPELEQRGGTHFTLPLASKNPLQMIRNVFSLKHLIRKHKIQVIHARSRAPAWSALWAARLSGIPFVTTFHGAYNASNSLKNFYNSIMARGDRVIAISDFIANRIQTLYPKLHGDIRIIHEGIDVDELIPTSVAEEEKKALRQEWGIPEDAFIFLLPGRVSVSKGQLDFIEAFRNLNEPNVWGVILGRDQGKSYPKKVSEQLLGLPIRRITHNKRARMAVAYAAADCIVFPSITPEAFGRITAEAGAMERIVIATNHGATPELCQPGKTGYLIPPHQPAILAETMKKVMDLSTEEQLTMGKAARNYIKASFSIQRMCAETIELYKDVLS